MRSVSGQMEDNLLTPHRLSLNRLPVLRKERVSKRSVSSRRVNESQMIRKKTKDKARIHHSHSR